MRIRDLQDKLRTHIRDRIDRGELTGTGLSREAGFQQAHLSNFLNSRRGLSLESMDRLLEILDLEILDLVDPRFIQRRVLLPDAPGRLQAVAMVSGTDAARLPRFAPEQVADTVSFKKTFLRKLKASDASNRGDWLRFVMVKLDAKAARAVLPLALPGARVLIDRHYNSLEPYRRVQPNLYAVAWRAACLFGYVSLAGDHLMLRPRNPEFPVELLRIERGKNYSDYIVGRVCHIAIEV